MPKIRLAMAQTNATVGDIQGNLAAAMHAVESAVAQGANLVQFPEMAVTGYPIEDLATRHSFVSSAEEAVAGFAGDLEKAGFGDVAVVIGHPRIAQTRNGWAIAHNSASVLLGGSIIGTYDKHHLPNYSVFDEYRNFVPGEKLLTFEFLAQHVSVVICEDIWQSGGPVAQIAANSTDLTLVLNLSLIHI